MQGIVITGQNYTESWTKFKANFLTRSITLYKTSALVRG